MYILQSLQIKNIGCLKYFWFRSAFNTTDDNVTGLFKNYLKVFFYHMLPDFLKINYFFFLIFLGFILASSG